MLVVSLTTFYECCVIIWWYYYIILFRKARFLKSSVEQLLQKIKKIKEEKKQIRIILQYVWWGKYLNSRFYYCSRDGVTVDLFTDLFIFSINNWYYESKTQLMESFQILCSRTYSHDTDSFDFNNFHADTHTTVFKYYIVCYKHVIIFFIDYRCSKLPE